MIVYLFTPPGLYYLIGFIIVLSVIAYWKREPIKKELRRWRGKEISVGPLKLERKEKEGKPEAKAGINFGTGNDFTGAKIKRVAGRDIRPDGTAPAPGGATPGVDFGEKGKFRQSEIEDIAGRDLEERKKTS